MSYRPLAIGLNYLFSYRGFYGCSPTKPIVHYASENTISIKYSAFDEVPTVTAEAIDMAIKHCASYG